MNRSATFMEHQHFSERILSTDTHFSKRIKVFKNHSANHRKSPKSTTFVFNKRSVTSMRKYPITQHVVSNSGYFTKGVKKGGITHIYKAMKYSDLHLSPHSVYL